MTVKEYLRQYIDAKAEIDRKLNEISTLRELAYKVTATLSDDRVVCTTDSDRGGSIVSRFVLLEEEIELEIAKLFERRARVKESIEALEDPRLREILELRYISGLQWEQVAVRANYDYRWVTRLHRRALRLLESDLAKPLASVLPYKLEEEGAEESTD